MKRNVFILLLALFAFACSGNPDNKKESNPETTETAAVEEAIGEIEEAAKEVTDEVEDIAADVDSLIENL